MVTILCMYVLCESSLPSAKMRDKIWDRSLGTRLVISSRLLALSRGSLKWPLVM